MARRVPWTFLLGVGAALVLLRVVARARRPARGKRRASLPREPEVVWSNGPTPVEAGLERPVASARPDVVPGRSFRSPMTPERPRPPGPARFEPVVADAPEERDPALEPRREDPDAKASPVLPHRRHH